jgi:hypothetical protein
MPLNLEKENFFSGKSSLEWLDKNGLKALKLNLYQVLAPNAYSYKEDFVPILNKTVQSQVHEVDTYFWITSLIITVLYRLSYFEYKASDGSVHVARWHS